MLPLTLGVFVYSLFMRVGCFVCVTLPLIILYYHLPLYNQQFTPYLIMHGYVTSKQLYTTWPSFGKI